MKPELATTPRQTPLVLRYEGGVTGLLSDLQGSAEVLEVRLHPRSSIEVRNHLEALRFGRLRFRKDIKLFRATLPNLLFELRLDLSDENFQPIKARLFVAEKPPNEILLLGWFLKQPTKAGEARLLQNQAAQKALQTWLGSD